MTMFKNGFDEMSLPNFFGSSYSTVKGYTDQLMHMLEYVVLNVRIRMPITDELYERNFITKIITYEKILSIPNSMTVLNELLPFMVDMMLNKQTGTINLVNPELISNNEILEMYRDIVDENFTWKNFSDENEIKNLSSKRSNNYLSTDKLERLYPQVKNIKESIRGVLSNFKNQKNILVTGGCGFIGSNFINRYFYSNPNVNFINLDALYYCGDIKNIKEEIQTSPRYKFIHGNLCDEDVVSDIIKHDNIDIVIHFAAQSHVDNSFENSLQYTKDNVLGTHTLLEACRKYGNIEKFIHVSTDEVYGESMLENEVKKCENSLICPTNPYAATKASAEFMANSYYYSFNMPIVITRGNNVYGPNQYPEKLVPKFIKLLREDKPVTIQGDGSNVRGFLHVNDVCDAFEHIIESGKIGEIYNIGCDERDEYSVLEITHILIELVQKTRDFNKWITYIKDRPFNDKRYYISSQKMKDLGWKIKINFLEGLNSLINDNV